jgi:prevent-host-death family protein
MLYNVAMATTIAQRQLRNEMPEVLRRVEQGERFTITVNGRATAELGPLPGGRVFAAPERLAAVLTEAPADPGWAEELCAVRAEERAAVGEQ